MSNIQKISFVLLFFFVVAGFLHAQNLEIHHINVGQGDCTLVIGPDGSTILIDAGNNGKGVSVVIPYLQKLSIDEIDYLIATHMHADHIGGLDEVLQSVIQVHHVYDNGSSATTSSYNDYVSASDTYADGRNYFQPGMTVQLGDGAYAKCICSDGKTVTGSMSLTNENDKSVVLFIDFDNFQYVIGGDLGGGGSSQANVESFIAPLVGDVDVLRVNHHGSTSSTNTTYLNTITPEVAIISVGDNSYGHPTQAVLNSLYNKNIDVLQTGAGENPSGKVLGHIVIIVSKGKKYKINNVKRFKDERIRDKNKAPDAGFTYTVSAKKVSFDATSSWDDKKIKYYYWNFGDGKTFAGSKAKRQSHTYQNYGQFNVSLSVSDKYGITDTIYKTVAVTRSAGIKVTASASPLTPEQFSLVKINVSAKTELGLPIKGATVKTVAHYKTTDTTKTGTTDSNGEAVINYSIGNATPGYKVWVDVTVSYQGNTATTMTSFTPKGETQPETLVVSASASPSNPVQYSHVKIYITVKDKSGSSVSGASVKTVANYKTTKTTQYGTTGSTGMCTIDYYISSATKGYTVWVDVNVTKGGISGYARTSFTPR